MEDESTKPTDPISGLPQPIIHHILSFLPYNNVVKRLSKTWNRNCKSSPYLDFDDFRFHDLKRHVKFITKTLRRFHYYNLQILRLTIPISTFRPDVVPSTLDSWIALALQHGVEELNLEIRFPRSDNRYDLSREVFDAKSIKVAKFVGCSLLKSIPHDRSPSFNLLKLSLDNVLLNEVCLSSIISSCPLIEDLSILNCEGIDCIRISNLHKLKTLVIIQGRGAVEIDASSLQSLNIRSALQIDILECPKLTHLFLNGVTNSNSDLEDILSRLSSLRSLYLMTVLGLTKLKVSSNTLNKLEITGCGGLVEIDIDAPNLLSVEYRGGFDPLSSSSLNILSSQWDVFTGANIPSKAETFFVGLRNFVSNANHCKHLYLDLGSPIQPSFSFEELNERVVMNHPAGYIDHLEVSVRYQPAISYSDLVDGLLWSCKPCTLSMKLSPLDNNYYFMEHLCKIIAGHDRDCQSCTPARSWLHHLEYVKYVTEDGIEEQLPLNENGVDGLEDKILKSACSTKVKFNFKWCNFFYVGSFLCSSSTGW